MWGLRKEVAARCDAQACHWHGQWVRMISADGANMGAGVCVCLLLRQRVQLV